MSITNELRDFAKRWPCTDYVCKDMLAIADRIDEEHESACAEAYGNGVMSVPIALDESQWIKLPVDADGEPIHIGDVLTDDAEFKSEGKVMRLMLEDDGWMVGLGCGGWTEPSIHEWHHHHAPTVEDVLREFGRGWHEQMNGPETFDIADYVERYAAKLRLAGDAE